MDQRKTLDVPVVPRLEPNLTYEHVLAWIPNGSVPLEVLLHPLFCENTKECRSKAEDEAEEQ